LGFSRLAVFRVDAAVWMGLGHLSRCLTLARELRESGWSTRFLISSVASAWASRILSDGHDVEVLEFTETTDPGEANYQAWNWAEDAAACQRSLRSKVDWLIVDHYALGALWERSMQGWVDRIMVIDDLANRHHDCDLLLDQNLKDENSYRHLLPDRALALLGPPYALLRPEFRTARRTRDFRSIGRLNVFMGGTDPSGSLLYVLSELSGMKIAGFHVDVIVGSRSPALSEASRLLAYFPSAELHIDTDHVAGLFAAADLAIGAGGVAALERCAVGLPSVSVSVAQNQDAGLASLAKLQVIEYLGSFDRLRKNQMMTCLQNLFTEADRLQEMSERALSLVDGFGSQRVAQLLS
jgi:UDP-2,4-diacetamido-2,4,6-trideoxy-beta-L-altropyranose hydrolase